MNVFINEGLIDNINYEQQYIAQELTDIFEQNEIFNKLQFNVSTMQTLLFDVALTRDDVVASRFTDSNKVLSAYQKVLDV